MRRAQADIKKHTTGTTNDQTLQMAGWAKSSMTVYSTECGCGQGPRKRGGGVGGGGGGPPPPPLNKK
jgi:hypothetical protein